MKAIVSGSYLYYYPHYQLEVSINLRKIETNLSKFNTPSAMIKNEIQEIEFGTYTNSPASIVKEFKLLF